MSLWGDPSVTLPIGIPVRSVEQGAFEEYYNSPIPVKRCLTIPHGRILIAHRSKLVERLGSFLVYFGVLQF
jgi:hypothetical protein